MELAETYIYTGRHEEAIKTYEQVLVLDPAETEARINLATLYYYGSQYDPAIAQLQDIIQRDPGNKGAHYLYGIVLGTGKKDYSAAIAEMEKFISLAGEGTDVEKARQAIEEWKGAAGQ
ncbi:MAG: Tetratricopeptide repeat protein [Firmicutes bacterium ADurb.Bin456]|nr:MAG: Tetratricopeptide repeat protein [Firmicutes bacterium ADurb.Bin456]